MKKRFVPGYTATTNFENGIRQSIGYFKAHPELQKIDVEPDTGMDKFITAYESFTVGLTKLL